MTFVVRAVQEADLVRVAHLVADAYLADGLLTEDHEYVGELRAAAHRADEATVLVAAQQDEVLGTVTIAVAPANDSPTAVGAARSTAEDTALAVDLDPLTDDVDGDVLTASATGASRGTQRSSALTLATVSAPRAAFSAMRSAYGASSFTARKRRRSPASSDAPSAIAAAARAASGASADSSTLQRSSSRTAE